MDSNSYFNSLDAAVKGCYDLAKAARAKGLDPVNDVETPIATSLAEKVIGLISVMYPQLNDGRIVKRIIELEREYGPLEMAVSLKIAEEIAKEHFCKFESLLQAIDAGIRVGFAYTTIGVVSSPLEGFTGLKLNKTREGKDYFVAYFSGPIRSAGTTAGCVALMIIDYLRELFGFAKYDPDEQEVRRYVTENYDYHERVTNLQYLPTEEEIVFLAKNLPIQISGEPTEDREVSNYKDLARVETNFIRGGMCLIFSEGLAQKAQKGFGLLKKAQERGFISTGWNFLADYIALHKKREKGSADSSPTYIKDLVAGRPVFGHPSRSGSFRFRYGLSRVNGFSAASVHPATMGISGNFLSFGTQLKVEKPTKGCAISSCDQMDGPIVKMLDGRVRRVETLEEAKRLYPDVVEILYLGDVLFSLGDVMNRNYDLLKPGYVEEWWGLELEKRADARIVADPFAVSFEQAVELSVQYDLPMHPRYIYYWTQIDRSFFLALIDWIGHGHVTENKLVLPYAASDRERFVRGKRALEIVGCEHIVGLEHVVISLPDSAALLYNLGVNLRLEDFEVVFENSVKKLCDLPEAQTLELVNHISKAVIKDKAGTFIGARMGRPEKAKLRKLVGSPHALFPVGKQGGRLRSVTAAVEEGVVRAEFGLYFCDACNKDAIYPCCPDCGAACKRLYYCRSCDARSASPCLEHDNKQDYCEQSIDVRAYYDKARALTGVTTDMAPIVKGVRGTSNKDHSCEHLGKGMLRAKHNLHVNKDGTIRYDMTEMPLNHFRPREIGTSIELLRGMGYTHDIDEKPLEQENQMLALLPHDIVLPACHDSDDEPADETFMRVCAFVDDELERMYKLPRFYNVKSRSDLVGQLFVCIAPHICTATVGRLIGFSKTQAMLASPFMHAAMRRDCDGDEAAVILLMDMLLNFSRKFLPAHRGGTQDAPLVLNTKINAGDVDDQILTFELGPYPLEMYEYAEQGKHSSEVKIDNVKSRLKEGKNPFYPRFFTHNTHDLNGGITNSSYKSLPSMSEKVDAMMTLCKKLRAVDVSDVARLVIERHFIRDTRGNLRKFSMQVFRCVGCNEKFRRPPLAGRCTCGGKLIFTISEGSIVKYLATALELARTYQVSPYLLECLELVEKDIESLFGKDKEKQEQLAKWFGQPR